MALTYDPHQDPPENKWGFESHNYSGFQGRVDYMGSVREYFSNSNKMSVGFKDEKDVRAAKELLEKAGFKDVKTEGNSVSAYEQDGKGLAAFAAALATEHDLGRGQTLHAVLERADARQLIAQELERTGVSFQQAGLMNLSTVTLDNSHGQRYGVGVESQSYRSAYFNDMGPIVNIREYDTGSSFAVRYAQLTAQDGMGHVIEEKLAAAGFSVERENNSSHMRVKATQGGREANLNNVTQALAGANLMPTQMANEITAKPAAPDAAAPAMQQKVSASAPAGPGARR